MFRSLALVTLLGVSAVSAIAPAPIPRKCGSTVSDVKFAAAEKHFAANKDSFAAASFATAKNKTAKIDVYFHVIQKDNTTEGGNVP
jgi:hypothetical protein